MAAVRSSSTAANTEISFTKSPIQEFHYHENDIRIKSKIFKGIPACPNKLIGRDDILNELLENLCSSNINNFSIVGLPGSGKTAIAATLANHPQVIETFTGGVLWIGIGQNQNIFNLLIHFAQLLEAPLPVELKNNKVNSIQFIRDTIGIRKLLIIFDDIWEEDIANDMTKCCGNNCSLLATTRSENIAHSISSEFITRPAPLDKYWGGKLIQSFNHIKADKTNQQLLENIAERVGGLPLSLELIGKYLSRTTSRATDSLRSKAIEKIFDANARKKLLKDRLGSSTDQKLSLQDVIELSLKNYSETEKQLFHSLGAFAPQPCLFSWQATQEILQTDEETIAIFVNDSLLQQNGDFFLSIHQEISNAITCYTTNAARDAHRKYYMKLFSTSDNASNNSEHEYEQIRWAWEKSSDDNTKLEILWSVEGFQDYRGFYDDRKTWAEKSLIITNKLHQNNDQVKVLRLLGEIDLDNGFSENAYEKLHQSYRLSKNDRLQQAITMSSLGNCCTFLKKYREGECFLLNSYSMSIESMDSELLCKTLSRLGMLYSSSGNKTKAYKTFQQLIKNAKINKNKLYQAIAFNNFGSLFLDNKNKKGALLLFLKSRALLVEIGDIPNLIRVLLNLGATYNLLDDESRSIEILKEALSTLSNRSLYKDKIITLENLANIFIKLNQQEEALQCWLAAIDIANIINDTDSKIRLSYNVSSYYFQHNDFRGTIKYLLKVIDLLPSQNDTNLSLSIYCLLGSSLFNVNELMPSKKYYTKALKIATKYNNEYISLIKEKILLLNQQIGGDYDSALN